MTENPTKIEARKRQPKPRRSGQVIARGEGKWLVRIFLGRDSANGERRYFNKTLHGSKKDAEKYLREMLRRRDMGEMIEPTSELADTFFKKWMTTVVKPRVRDRSYQRYEQSLNLYVLPELGQKRLADIRSIDIQHFYAKLLDRNLASSTIRFVHCLISNAFKQAVRWHMVRENPALHVDLPRMEKREMMALTAEEARNLLKASEGTTYHPVFVFLLASGCRPGEALGLKWPDIDWQAGTVTIRRALYWRRDQKGWEITEPKNERSRRTIPLGAAVIKVLAELKRHQAEDRLRAGGEWTDLEIVFTKANGSPVFTHSLSAALKEALKRAELPTSLRLYDLRHSCASILMSEGLNPKVVSERLGHSNISLTLQTYSHVSKGMQDAASDRLEKALFG